MGFPLTLRSQAPTIVALTEQFNFTAQWLMEELATASENAVRTEVLEKAIKIAAACPIRLDLLCLTYDLVSVGYEKLPADRLNTCRPQWADWSPGPPGTHPELF